MHDWSKGPLRIILVYGTTYIWDKKKVNGKTKSFRGKPKTLFIYEAAGQTCKFLKIIILSILYFSDWYENYNCHYMYRQNNFVLNSRCVERTSTYILHMKNILTKENNMLGACWAGIKQQKALNNNSIIPLTCKFLLM